MKGLTALLLLAAAAIAQAQTSKVLTAKNFEHATQAATGQTTGVWLVRFCDGKEAGCLAGQDGWEELSEELGQLHQIILADVNVAADPSLAARFGVTRLPAYLLLRDRKMARMPGATSDRDEVYEWVMGRASVAAAVGVPPEASPVGAAVEGAKKRLAAVLAGAGSKVCSATGKMCAAQ